MKIRLGHVSNSSSSSFIVIFPFVPESSEQLKKLLFNDKECYTSEYSSDAWTTKQIAEIVFDDIKDQKPNDLNNIIGMVDNDISINSFKDGDGNIDWEKYDFVKTKVDTEKALDFIDENKGSFIYTFNFSDDTSIGSAMEHGDLFDNLCHKRISNH